MLKTVFGAMIVFSLLFAMVTADAQNASPRSGSANPTLGLIRQVGGVTPWAVVLCKFADVDTPAPDATFFEDFFTGAGKGGIFDYFAQVSYKAVSIRGTVVEKAADNSWFKLPKKWKDYKDDPDGRFHSIVDCAKMAESSLDFSRFFGIIAVLNKDIDGGAVLPRDLSLNGKTQVYALLNLPPFGWNITFAAQEMAHGYYLPHSFSSDFIEYGDPYDVMSGFTCAYFSDPRWGASGPDLNTGFKIQLGWIPQDRILHYNGGDVTVRLSPVSRPETNELLAVEIPRRDEPRGAVKDKFFYTVEYRTKTGWDRGLPGDEHGIPGGKVVLVRQVFPPEAPFMGRTVVATDITHLATRTGGSFSDPHTGIYIDVNDMNDEFATVSLHNLPVSDPLVCAPSVSCTLSVDFYCDPVTDYPILLQQRQPDGGWNTIWRDPQRRRFSNPVIDVIGAEGTTTYRVCTESERGTVCTSPMDATVPNGHCISGSGENLTRCGGHGLPPCRSDQP
jgi:hypothetical protein